MSATSKSSHVHDSIIIIVHLHCSESELAGVAAGHDLVTTAVIHQPADAGQVQVYL